MAAYRGGGIILLPAILLSGRRYHTTRIVEPVVNVAKIRTLAVVRGDLLK